MPLALIVSNDKVLTFAILALRINKGNWTDDWAVKNTCSCREPGFDSQPYRVVYNHS